MTASSAREKWASDAHGGVARVGSDGNRAEEDDPHMEATNDGGGMPPSPEEVVPHGIRMSGSWGSPSRSEHTANIPGAKAGGTERGVGLGRRMARNFRDSHGEGEVRPRSWVSWEENAHRVEPVNAAKGGSCGNSEDTPTTASPAARLGSVGVS